MTFLNYITKNALRGILCLLFALPLTGAGECSSAINVKNPYMWSDYPDPDIIRVDDYYYLVTTTMHMFPAAPVMRSKDLIDWEVVSYLCDSIKDTPRYDLQEGTVYGRGQWATTLRYNNGTFWALFVANDDPHKSMVFKTDDPTKGWTLHSRLPAYHDSSLFFDDDGRVYVFSGSGNIRLVELEPDLTDVKKGGINKVLELKGKPEGLHEGSRVIKHDGMYYLLCISWPRTGRQEICYRSKNIEGPYDSKVILKSDFGGFPFAGQGTIVNGKHGEWYGVIFQDRGAIGRVLTIEPCSWIDGWPMLGTFGDGKIPETVKLYGEDGNDDAKESINTNVKPDYQWNHNFIREDITTATGSLTQPGKWVSLSTAHHPLETSVFDARNTLTWRTWGPACTDTISIDASRMKDGDRVGFSAFNGDAALVTVRKDGSRYVMEYTEESVQLTNDTKAITAVERKDLSSLSPTLREVKLSGKQLKDIRISASYDFSNTPGKHGGNDMVSFSYSLDKGKTWKVIGRPFHMVFDYRRLFMGTRSAVFYYPTKQKGGTVKVQL